MPRKMHEADRDTPGGEFGLPRPSFTKHDQSRNSGEWSCVSPIQDVHKIVSEPQSVDITHHHLDLQRPPLPCLDTTRWDCSTADSISTLAGRSVSTPSSTLPMRDIEPGLQVLVVDDDRMTRMLMERMLERLRCVVTTAINGQQALKLLVGDISSCQPPQSDENWSEMMGSSDAGNREIVEDGSSLQLRSVPSCLEESKFAIVFLDNQMPVMSGVEMVQRLRKLGRRDLVVGVTGAVYRHAWRVLRMANDVTLQATRCFLIKKSILALVSISKRLSTSLRSG
jgi:CheY-like chemotaxis protein